MPEHAQPLAGDDVIMTDQPETLKAAGTSLGESIRQKLAEHGEGLRTQAQDKAFSFAAQGKDKATDALDGISKFVSETANTLENQLGSGVGDYAHRAADAIAELTETLKSKDIEELFQDAQDAIRRNPAIAIGAAAAAGFVLLRLVKASGGAADETATTPTKKTASSTKSK